MVFGKIADKDDCAGANSGCNYDSLEKASVVALVLQLILADGGKAKGRALANAIEHEKFAVTKG